MKRITTLLSVLLAAGFILSNGQKAAAQPTTSELLSLVPEGAIAGGHAQVGWLLDIERLESFVASWATILGTEQAESLVAEMRQAYADHLEIIATNVSSCVLYFTAIEEDDPNVVCVGAFGPEGYVPPAEEGFEVVTEQLMVNGPQSAELIARLDSLTPAQPHIASVAIDPELAAHFVVQLPEGLTADAGPELAFLGSMRTIEVRIAEDSTQVGGITLEVRFGTPTEQDAQQLMGMLQLIAMPLTASTPDAGIPSFGAQDIQSWFRLEENVVVIAPNTEALATMTAIAIPAFLQYVEAARETVVEEIETIPITPTE